MATSRRSSDRPRGESDPRTFIVFHKPFAEQLAAFQLRMGNLVPTSRWDDVWKGQHDRAGMVAGATKAELIADILGAVYKSAEQGTTFDNFQKDFRAIVEKHGWHGWTGEGTAKGEAWRMRVIYQTNLRTSYMAGRHAQLMAGGFKYWIYRHGGSAEPRLHHLALDGLILQPDHPFWQTHYPPNGWGCRCRVFGSHSLRGAKAKGGDPDKVLPDGWDSIEPKTGEPPGIDKGWGYAPGASVVEDVQLGARMLAGLPPKIGADFGESMLDLVDDAWSLWLEAVRAGTGHDKAMLGVISKPVQQALKAEGIETAGAEVLMRAGLVKGPKADRHEAKGDALTAEQWARLPELFRTPRAVLIDRRTGALLYVLGGDAEAGQLAVRLDFRGKNGSVNNEVVSAYRPVMGQVLARIGAGVLSLLFGGL